MFQYNVTHLYLKQKKHTNLIKSMFLKLFFDPTKKLR